MSCNGGGRPRTRALAALSVLALLLTACGGGGNAEPAVPSSTGSSTTTPSGGSQTPAPSGTAVTSLAAWGDSLTAGNGGDGTSYPGVLSELAGLPMFNGGVAGERSAGVAARQGGVPAQLNVAGGTIPAEGGVQVDLGDVVIIRDEGSLTGTLLDVHGTLTKDQQTNFGDYTFTRDEPGQPVPVPDGTPFVTDVGVENRTSGTVIWSGHNDIRFEGPNNVVDNIRAMVDYLQTDHYVVIGLSNGENAGEGSDYYTEAILGVNEELAQEFGPDHYLDVREWLVQEGLAAAGIEPTASDQEDISQDIVPLSLRDPRAVGHLNPEGYRLVGKYLDDFCRAHGWY